MSIESARDYIISIVGNLPTTNENDIAAAVEELVANGIIHRSSPPASTNHQLNNALFILNRVLKQIKEE